MADQSTSSADTLDPHGSDPCWSKPLASCLALCGLIACIPLVDWCIRTWSTALLGGAATALLAIPIALVLGGMSARRPREMTQPPISVDWVYGTCLTLLAFGTAVTAGDSPWMLAVGICAVCCIWSWLWGSLGWSLAKHLVLPVFFVVFALPWEFYLRPLIQIPLQAWTTDIAMLILKTMGYVVWYYNEYTIDSDPYYVIVNETCSGINMVVALTMYTLIFAWAVQAHMKTRWGLMALIFPVAMLANGIRVTAIFLMGYYGGTDLANGPWHTGSAYLIFLPVFWFIFVAYQFMERRFRPASKISPSPED